MNTLPLVHFDDSWEWIACSDTHPVPDHDTIWKPLPSLESLAHLARREDNLWLRTTFVLEPLDACVRYLLHLNGEVEALHLNGAEMSSVGLRNGLDVTGYVALEDNVLMLKLNSPQALSRIWLQPVPCDES